VSARHLRVTFTLGAEANANEQRAWRRRADLMALAAARPTDADHFGYVAFGEDELYARGALFSALRLLHYCPSASIKVLTDRPHIFDGYPIETINLTPRRMAETSFGGRYKFGIKAAGIIELLKRCDRLFFMDTDIYPVGDISKCFGQISASRSIMWRREGRPRKPFRSLDGQGIALGGRILTGNETMWASAILGIHRDNISRLVDAYATVEQMIDIVRAHTPEQFCVGVALSSDGRKIGRHRLPLYNYTTKGKKLFARQRITSFFDANGHLSISQQIDNASKYRIWRTPVDVWDQRHIWSFGWADRLLRPKARR
jgi:hypothetical protein